MADIILKQYLKSGMFIRFRAISKIIYKTTVYQQTIWDIDDGCKKILYMPISIGNNYYNIFRRMQKRKIEHNYIFTILAFRDYGKVYAILDALKKEDLINKYFLFCDQVFRSRVEDIIDSNLLGTDLKFIYDKLRYYYTIEELEVFVPDFIKDAFDKNRI